MDYILMKGWNQSALLHDVNNIRTPINIIEDVDAIYRVFFNTTARGRGKTKPPDCQ